MYSHNKWDILENDSFLEYIAGTKLGKCSEMHQFDFKYFTERRLVLGPPPFGNPGSATEYIYNNMRTDHGLRLMVLGTDVNKTKFLRPRTKWQDQDQDQDRCLQDQDQDHWK